MKTLSTQTKQTMSSLEIAELTGKTHAVVIGDIKRILAEVEIDSSVFQTIYLDSMNREKPCFNLPRRECDLVVAGYSAKYRLAIIDRWQELESKAQQPAMPTHSEALRLYADALDALEQAKPRIEFANAVRNMQGACAVGDFAKTIGTGRNKLFKLMRDDEILMSNNLPYQRYIDQGCFVVIEQIPYTDRNGKTHPAFTTMVTGKGQVFLEKRYRKEVA